MHTISDLPAARKIAAPARLAAAAARYAAAGWPVLPLEPRGKVPLIAGGYLAATTDVATVRAWWGRWARANIGVRPGPAGYVAVDLDGVPGETAAAALGLVREPTLTVVTGRGRHLWFRRPDGRTTGNLLLAPGVEVRADAGYVVVPPSVHPSGATYRWAGRVAEALPLPPEARAALERARARSVTPPAGARTGRPTVAWAYPPGRVRRRIEAYVAHLPAGLRNGEGRNPVAYRLAAWLVRDLQLDDAAALEVLAYWNRRQRELLDGRELEVVLSDAHRYGRRPYGAAYAKAAR